MSIADVPLRAADGPDYGDSEAVVRHVVDLMKAYMGDSPYFDEHATRALAEQDVARTKNMASALSNHFAINFDGPKSGGLGDIAVPALVVHGELDPVFPLPHGKALARAIPGANLLILEDTGHDVPALRYDVFIDVLVRHTGRGA